MRERIVAYSKWCYKIHPYTAYECSTIRILCFLKYIWSNIILFFYMRKPIVLYEILCRRISCSSYMYTHIYIHIYFHIYIVYVCMYYIYIYIYIEGCEYIKIEEIYPFSHMLWICFIHV